MILAHKVYNFFVTTAVYHTILSRGPRGHSAFLLRHIKTHLIPLVQYVRFLGCKGK